MILVIYLVRFFILGILFTWESYDGSSLVFGLSNFLWDPVSLQGHDGSAYEGFLDAREVNTQVNELLHGASMIQLYHQEPGVVDEFEVTTQKMLGANEFLLADSIVFDLNGIAF